ncbi:hypothetical protein VTJ04DRAFT_3770 [Mycothermus thermophilus]|uniref:uncharacterized protein n=1 Tax=Humicola insolens TaxID=85995 RepID=UPI003742958A
MNEGKGRLGWDGREREFSVSLFFISFFCLVWNERTGGSSNLVIFWFWSGLVWIEGCGRVAESNYSMENVAEENNRSIHPFTFIIIINNIIQHEHEEVEVEEEHHQQHRHHQHYTTPVTHKASFLSFFLSFAKPIHPFSHLLPLVSCLILKNTILHL